MMTILCAPSICQTAFWALCLDCFTESWQHYEKGNNFIDEEIRLREMKDADQEMKDIDQQWWPSPSPALCSGSTPEQWSNRSQAPAVPSGPPPHSPCSPVPLLLSTPSPFKLPRRVFPGGPAVTNLPCSAGDTGSIPGWRTKISQARGPGSSWMATREAPMLQTKTPYVVIKTPCSQINK